MQSTPRAPSSAGTGLNRPGHQTSTSSLSSTGSNTHPLKIGKQTTAYASSGSSLVGGVKGGVPVARRQSASFNHVRTSSLVSSSPFKTGGNTVSSTSNASYLKQTKFTPEASLMRIDTPVKLASLAKVRVSKISQKPKLSQRAHSSKLTE